MQVAFLSGPYRAGNGRTVRENIRAAERAALVWWRRGYAVICPHLNTAFFDGELPDEVWLEGDLAILERLRPCIDAAVFLPGWQQSEGSRIEFDKAREFLLNIHYHDPGAS